MLVPTTSVALNYKMAGTRGMHRGIGYGFSQDAAENAATRGIDLEKEMKRVIDSIVDNAEAPKRTAEVYSKENCPFCVRAKALLTQEGISYTEIHAVQNKEALVERVTKDTGRPPMTVPQIYLDGKYVGGYTELAKLIAAEKNA